MSNMEISKHAAIVASFIRQILVSSIRSLCASIDEFAPLVRFAPGLLQRGCRHTGSSSEWLVGPEMRTFSPEPQIIAAEA